MRLDKYLSDAAQQSRGDARKLIAKGKVSVNGIVCKKADCQVAESDIIALDGKKLCAEKYIYIMLDKPQGIVSAATDKRDITVVDLVGKAYPRRNLFPAGRLDKTSTGFVLITDDGNFAHRILSPAKHVSKTYEVELDTPVTQAMVDGFTAGVTLADGQTMHPAQLVPHPAHPMCATVVLTQGVYHQIKRMFGVYEAGVNGLRRTAIGQLSLDESLGAGGFRLLSLEELARITAQNS